MKLHFPQPVGGPVLVYIPIEMVPPRSEDLAKGGTLQVQTSLKNELRATPTLAEIKTELARIAPHVEACGQGKGRVQLTITPEGRVEKAEVLGALAGSELASCVEKRIMTFAKFPASKGGVKTSVPFRLTK
jgi:hypothetical protein